MNAMHSGTAVVIVLLVFADRAPAATIESVASTLRHGQSVNIAGDRICATQPLPLFYSRRGYRPAWSRADETALLDALRRAGDDGLNPDDYHLAAINATGGDEHDVLLTDAFFLFASHLLSGRTDPITIEPTWCLEPRTSNIVPALETALENHDVGETLARFRCAHDGYCRLRDHLARYRTLRDWPHVDEGRSLKTGATGRRAEQLIARLLASGELTGSHQRVDADVIQAVKTFQRSHGLEPDGVAGPHTIREMNVPLAQRIRQIELNLERWRWLPATLGDRHAVINIPQFQLTVVERDKTVLTMRIVVGKDFESHSRLQQRDQRGCLQPVLERARFDRVERVVAEAAREPVVLCG